MNEEALDIFDNEYTYSVYKIQPIRTNLLHGNALAIILIMNLHVNETSGAHKNSSQKLMKLT